MRIVIVRRISQAFFLLLLLWLAVVATVGTEWWQMRGWPIDWLLQLDPLVALGTLLATRTLYSGLIWAVATLILTILLGRFFCGWVCPFGTMHQVVGYLGNRGRSVAHRIAINTYRRGATIKYYILAAMLVAAAAAPGTLLTGFLDPIPLAYRSVNLVLLPIADAKTQMLSATQRYYEWGWLTGTVFLTALALNLLIPRFYCRFVCPLGALLGIFGRFAIWRIGKSESECSNCKLCQEHCEGGCEPAGRIRISECVLCMNCMDPCRHNVLRYRTEKSEAGERTSPDVTRRGLMLSLVSGLAAAPLMRLGGSSGSNWDSSIIRPPGSLAEEGFLERCIRCGQCMRVCPTNVIQPGGFEGGLETLWTPMLNNRIGSSGCQLNCVACGKACPTAAIRPISLDEKLGGGKFADAGPIRLGAAFVDRGRCLPWAMDTPCIVCQENCPVSPKAIEVREVYNTIRNGILTIEQIHGDTLEFDLAASDAGHFAGGDFYCLHPRGERVAIVASTGNSITLAAGKKSSPPAVGETAEIQVRLQQPYVDVRACIGCGICEHECPVSGTRAIRVSAENESRDRNRRLLL